MIIKDIEFVNDKVGFIVGEGGAVFKTINGGKSWKKIKIRNPKPLITLITLN
ncbi:MAG: hypothetical protein FVQ77_01535 [Cytophagales bacterium]|nr:hypothetical protein [Cytophagales bacterium]